MNSDDGSGSERLTQLAQIALDSSVSPAFLAALLRWMANGLFGATRSRWTKRPKLLLAGMSKARSGSLLAGLCVRAEESNSPIYFDNPASQF